MNIITKLLVAGTAVALPFAAVNVPFTAAAQSPDAAYCATLSKLYRNTVPKTQDANVEVPVAMAKCDEGDTATGIPILERALKDMGVTLPPRA
jgi:hypothetical protein